MSFSHFLDIFEIFKTFRLQKFKSSAAASAMMTVGNNLFIFKPFKRKKGVFGRVRFDDELNHALASRLVS